MTVDEKIRSLLNPRLRDIHQSMGGTVSMGDLAVYVGQPVSDAMKALADFVVLEERQRAVEICDLHLERMIDRERCARALRNPNAVHPSGRGIADADTDYEYVDGIAVARSQRPKDEGI